MLKAILFDFNGVIINDEAIHNRLIDQLLIEENLRPKRGELRQICLGRSDRACLQDLFASRSRILSDANLDRLISRKSAAYQQELANLEKLPIYAGLPDILFNIHAAQLKIAIVTGALRSEVTAVLERVELSDEFSVIISGDEPFPSKPEPDGYLLAVKRLNELYPELNLMPADCLAIEDTFAGITAAKKAGIPVVGVANTYPFHMLQRCANWTVDYLSDLELDRVRQIYDRPTAA
ncbi:HAD family phosphatase [Phormidium sp. CLA17]|uniref:HAD family hydrolase n=1 Tax=Leptolyngbya sp. Cla-17 TaxID=2803751 RepID=UPI0014924919|nr:HAD family phosphatase [Leptolyngbya sp. Cla-17]MBM0740330.1 HAD family phosphatase [Leptolyngbya sp. Cla-17]